MDAPLEVLKFNLQERQYPYFEDAELYMLLENNESNVLKASWKGCLLKANADDGLNIGTIKTNSNREYWLGMAEGYKSDYEISIRVDSSASGYKTSMVRVDGQ